MLLRGTLSCPWARITVAGGRKSLLYGRSIGCITVHPQLSPRLFSAGATRDKETALVPSMVGYLVSSCGLSPDEAMRASKRLPSVRSPSNPDAVLSFLKLKGFDEEQIKKIVCSRPQLLCADVERTLEPKFRVLEEIGCRGASLFDVIKQNNRFLCCSQDKVILPNISLLMKDCGISGARILKILKRSSWVVSRSTSSLQELIDRVEELGFNRDSRMFEYALCVLSKYKRSTVASKLERFARFGWTVEEILRAIRLAPVLLTLSDNKLKKSMEFLMGAAGLEPACIASYPVMLMFSLEKRVMPRYRVMELLKSKGLPEGKFDYASALRLSEAKFLAKFVFPHVEAHPELEEVYEPLAPPEETPDSIAG